MNTRDGRDNDTSAYEHCRLMVGELRAWFDSELKEMRRYIDDRNRHRAGDIGTIGNSVANHESDLMRGERPGWVATRCKAIEDDVADLVEAVKAQAAASRRQNQLIIATLVALCANLVVLLVTLGGKSL